MFPGISHVWAPADTSNYYEARTKPYGGARRQHLAMCIHTPEERADNIETTPWWFQQPSASASTGYYVSDNGDIYQCVRDDDFAWAQGTRSAQVRQPRPRWWTPSLISYNTCMDSVELEGFAASIGRTFIPGGKQWKSAVALVAWKSMIMGYPPDREHVIAHSELNTQKNDPGAGFPWPQFIADVAGTVADKQKRGDAQGIASLYGKHSHSIVGLSWLKTTPPL